MNGWTIVRPLLCFALAAVLVSTAEAQLIDRTLAPNIANEGIAKSLPQQVGAGRGDLYTPGSSQFLIARDPFRSIRRGRQLFQRKFTHAQGQGPVVQDGVGDVNQILAIGAGLSDSCAGCHGRPRGSAGFGGDVVTRPDSRDAPHLFGLGLKEMLADEITSELRAIRDEALAAARASGRPTTRALASKGIAYGSITAAPDGSLDTGAVRGVNSDLRVRPFFAHGGKIAIREFVVGALNDEMGLVASDPDLALAASGSKTTTPAGMVMDGSLDSFAVPPNGPDEIDPALVDHLEFYLLNYFKPATYEQTQRTARGRKIFDRIGCATCHIPDLPLKRDRRVADVETIFDPDQGSFNGLFATATPLFHIFDDQRGFAPLKSPKGGAFLVKNIFTDFKRHDLGSNFYERNYDGTTRTEFLTTPLWGVGTTPPYGHDGRSINLTEVILRHGGEALAQANAFERLPDEERSAVLDFLNSLVLFPPDDTASNLNPANRLDPRYPQSGHGSIKLGVLFNDPTDPE
ncbi:MAG: thiol oxidoreductase-like protein [Verrucomicrobia bacterium]|nr:thiol oxidoreductase-like protein [Verrucomicrobiota bacterium]